MKEIIFYYIPPETETVGYMAWQMVASSTDTGNMILDPIGEGPDF